MNPLYSEGIYVSAPVSGVRLKPSQGFSVSMQRDELSIVKVEMVEFINACSSPGLAGEGDLEWVKMPRASRESNTR
jgi:hypothetical protein